MQPSGMSGLRLPRPYLSIQDSFNILHWDIKKKPQAFGSNKQAKEHKGTQPKACSEQPVHEKSR